MEEKEEKFKIADPALLHVITPSPFEIGPSRFMRWVCRFDILHLKSSLSISKR